MKLMSDISKRFTVLMMVFTMLVGLAQFGVYSQAVTVPETGVTQTFDLSIGNVTINSPGTYVITQSVEGVTRNTIIINSNATVYLSGVNIQVLKPVSRDDYSKPNPINISGSFTVDLYLVDGSTNTLASEEGTIVSGGWIRNGSGKAALRVPAGATLNIYGSSGVLHATGAQGKNHYDYAARGGGGSAIGGNGGINNSGEHYFEPAEASGRVNIYGGTIVALGGAAMGHHGQGGNAIGSGGLEYDGVPVANGAVSIYGGNVSLTGGLGTWSQRSGYAVAGDLHYHGGKLVAKSAPEGNTLVSPLSKAPLTTPIQYAWRLNAVDELEVSYVSAYTFESTQRFVELQEDFSGPYNVNAAKTAAQNASYLDTTQAIATSETIIINTLKEVAELAVNNDEITVSVNKVTYVLPTAGTSAKPLGTDGSYAFTITLTHGEYILTTDELAIAIVATAFDGVSDVDAVAAAKLAAQNASYLDTTQAVAITETVIRNTLKVVAELAISNESIAVTINRIKYVLPIAGTSANPLGVDGSYTFTVTVSKGDETLTSDEDSIAIIATAYEGVSDAHAVATAKAAAEAAKYLDTTQAIATSEDIIKDTLKDIAQLAVNDEAITVSVNIISYVLPIEGTPSNPTGIDGSVTFTITVSKGDQILTTEEMIIIIKATHTKLYNPDVIVEKDENAFEFDASGLEHVVIFSDEERVHEVFVKLVFSVLTGINVPTEDKNLIDTFIKTVLNYNKSEVFLVDISLFKMVGETSTPITNTLEEVTISFTLPVAFRGVEFDLIRVHDDEVEVIEYILDEETYVITFTSNKFSTFSLVSQLEEEIVLPETSDSSKLFNWLLMLLGFALLAVSVGFDKKSD
ncbi:MAG: hypothetical protein KGZ51_02135 [Erysipelothrix sp.]|jgi:hypothetical protein|nr:hypothetical protein [Erysipelothrix sp.]